MNFIKTSVVFALLLVAGAFLAPAASASVDDCVPTWGGGCEEEPVTPTTEPPAPTTTTEAPAPVTPETVPPTTTTAAPAPVTTTTQAPTPAPVPTTLAPVVEAPAPTPKPVVPAPVVEAPAPTPVPVVEVPVAPTCFAIGDLVWNDADGNGIQNEGELPLTGVAVSLTDASGVVASTVTNTNGIYGFDCVEEGDFRVSITAPEGFNPTVALNAGTCNDSNGNIDGGVTAAITVTGDDACIDFGLTLDPCMAQAVYGDDVTAAQLWEAQEAGCFEGSEDTGTPVAICGCNDAQMEAMQADIDSLTADSQVEAQSFAPVQAGNGFPWLAGIAALFVALSGLLFNRREDHNSKA